MISLLVRIAVNAVALWVAAHLVSGIALAGGLHGMLIVAVLFGLVNAFIRPIVLLFSLPAIVLTIGLFTFVVNGLMLWLTSQFTDYLYVRGLWSAIWGAVVISLVSWAMSHFIRERNR